MNQLTTSPTVALRGQLPVPGDKSISHRALMLGALAEGTSQISGFLPCGDCLATLCCLRALGIRINCHDATTITLHGRGLHGLQAPVGPLHCARSGTTMRLLAGILAGQPFSSTLTGDPQLLRRPMRRVLEPLRHMGAAIAGADAADHGPLIIRGARLRGFEHTLTIASAQVKSALLLAGLYADRTTVVRQCGPARDHTERMLAAMGADIRVEGLDVSLRPPPSLSPLSLHVPGDFSSAAFLLVAGALIPNAEITIPDVCINPTRTGLLDGLQKMDARFAIRNKREQSSEPLADLVISTSKLRGIEIAGHTVVRMIDELPVLAVAATQARGTTVVRDAAELRVKETDRIAAMAQELDKLGADITPLPDGFVIRGPTPLHGGTVSSHGDHRLAMALAVAGLVADQPVTIRETACIADSFPGFEEILHSNF